MGVPKIQGERTGIRPTTRNHLDCLARWWTNPDVMTPVQRPNGIVMSPDEWEAWLDSWCGGNDMSRRHFIIFDENDEPIGEIYYHDLDPGCSRAAIGAKIGKPELWGKRYAADAVKAFCTYMFDTIGVDELLIEVATANGRALAFWEKMRFTAYARNNDTVNMRLRAETFHSHPQSQS